MRGSNVAREALAPALRFDRTAVRPLLGIECAAAVGVPLVIGLATGHVLAGSFVAIGAFLAGFAVFQPGYRIRARIVVVASLIIAVGTFLGAITGVGHPGFFVLVAAWTFLAGMLVALGPNAAVVGVVSSVGLVIASSLDASPSLALEDGGFALCGGLGAAVLVLVFHWRGRRPEASALADAYQALAEYAADVGRGPAVLPPAAAFDTLAATLSTRGPHRYRELGRRDRDLHGRAEQLRTSLAACWPRPATIWRRTTGWRAGTSRGRRSSWPVSTPSPRRRETCSATSPTPAGATPRRASPGRPTRSYGERRKPWWVWRDRGPHRSSAFSERSGAPWTRLGPSSAAGRRGRRSGTAAGPGGSSDLGRAPGPRLRTGRRRPRRSSPSGPTSACARPRAATPSGSPPW